MIKLLNIILLTILLNSEENVNSDVRTFDYYKRLNDTETRLQKFRDDDEALKLKLTQLDVINVSRKKHKAGPVELDILASRVANKACREAAENGYISHWNMSGEKPYHRYAFAGGYDHVSENVYGESTSGTFESSPSDILNLMKSGHTSFMSERAPADGHKKNIISKTHNFVGIGFYLTGDEFRYNEEFIDRYLEFENIPVQVRAGEKTSITFRCTGRYYPYFILIYREDFPKPRKPSELNRTGSYPDFSNEEYLQLTAWEIARYKHAGQYIMPLIFKKEGLYYIQIYTDEKEITSPTRLNTKGKTPYSGIVIRVTK
ncbi:MAG: CAP domain-containing protein [Bacteroidia bacterium]|nr:CAP domain-containing protein [Bacteroidia bacterium]